MYQSIAILGSTGSIGTQTLDIIRQDSNISVCALGANRNIALLEKQIREFHPALAVVYDREAAATLRTRVADLPVRISSGEEGLLELATWEQCDLLVTAIVGMEGIQPTVAAISAGKDIALANKETMVCAGEIIQNLAKKHKVRILPVDSEHSAIFQCLQGNPTNPVRKILLTCSGGPFRGKDRAFLEHVTPEQALAHPTWSMGKKITIDCATLANKGLEVIEAVRLFGVSANHIQVIIHPQSIVHSMVEFQDGAVLAQLGTPDMRLPIAYALYYPERVDFGGEGLDFWQLPDLHFEKPNTESFPALSLAYEAVKTGGSMPALYNAANEAAVRKFLAGQCSFPYITEFIGESMAKHKVLSDPSLEDILKMKEEFLH